MQERLVADGKVIYEAEVSAGIDRALTLLSEVAGLEYARFVQLVTEYDPQSLFRSSSLEKFAVPEKAESLFCYAVRRVCMSAADISEIRAASASAW